MKKTVKTLSIVMMAFAMAVCFFFAGLTFVKADALADVDLGVKAGAQVLVAGDVEETGLRFNVEILKADYQTLVAGDAEVALGVQVGRYVDGSFTPLGRYVVETTDAMEEEGDYYLYSFAITYNLDRVFEGYEGTEAEKAELINKMYADELVVRPFYRLYQQKIVDGEPAYDDNNEAIMQWNYWYGVAGDARSMLHVAQAEIADETGTANKEALAAKYITATTEKGAVDVYSNGYVSVVDADVVAYTIDTSAKVVGREAGKISAEALTNYEANDTFKLFGYTADRKVYVYDATFKGEYKFDTVENTESVVVSQENKLYLNGTTLAGNTVDAIYYKGIDLVEAIAEGLIAEAPGSTITVVAKIGETYYEFTNALYVTMAFENTKESRLVMRDIFSDGGRLTSAWGSGVNNEANDGYYVLVENLTFDYSNVPMSEEDAANYVNDDMNAPYEFFNNYGSSAANTLTGTFDGRGYSLNNVGLVGNFGIFGYAGDGATIKNVAFNEMFFYTRKTVDADAGQYYYTIGGTGTGAYIFYQVTAADADVTFENVYINDNNANDNSTYGSLVFYRGIADEVEEGATQTYSHGNLTFKNVIIENARGPILSGATGHWAAGLTENDVIIDAYAITSANMARGAATLESNSRGENFAKYADYTAMAAAGNDYDTFSSAYWTIVNGVPVWNTAADIISINGAVSSSIFSETAGDTFTVTAMVKGAAVAVTLSTEGDDVVSIAGNVITAKEGVSGSATVTVTANGVALGTIAVTVNTMTATKIEQEVLLSKADGKLYFNGTDYASVVADAVAYNGASVGSAGVVDTTLINVAVNTGFALSVVDANGDKYELTNVKMYDGVYENDNRGDLVTLLKSYSGTLTGYYVLAENITFDTTATSERFSSANTRTFNATFDGRGYTLNNVCLPSGTFTGIFGTLPGADAVLKNFAINRIYTVGAESGAYYQGVLFGGANATSDNCLTMENVYIYRYASVAGGGKSWIFYYTTSGSPMTFKLNNVYIELDQDSSLANSNTGKGLGILRAAATTGTATNTYFTNGCGYTTYTVQLPGVVQLNSYDTLATRRTALAATEGVSFASFAATSYWTVAEGGVPTWKTLPTA